MVEVVEVVDDGVVGGRVLGATRVLEFDDDVDVSTGGRAVVDVDVGSVTFEEVEDPASIGAEELVELGTVVLLDVLDEGVRVGGTVTVSLGGAVVGSVVLVDVDMPDTAVGPVLENVED